MNSLLFITYNNYFNRQVKRFESLPYAYEFFSTTTPVRKEKINFNPNDGVRAELVVNWDKDFIPDYMLVCNEDFTSIESRWFVLETTRLRTGQYKFVFRRDLITDYFSPFVTATAFIERGWVDTSNPLIFNAEGVQVNQIKKSEIPLRDKTACGWIVGYLAPNIGAEGDQEVVITYPQETVPDISTFEYVEYIGQTIKGQINKGSSFFYVQGDVSDYWSKALVRCFFDGHKDSYSDLNMPANRAIVDAHVNEIKAANLDIDYAVFDTLLDNYLNNLDFNEILALEGRVYKDGNSYKKLVLEEIDNNLTANFRPTTATHPNITQEIINAFNALGYTVDVAPAVSGDPICFPTRIVYSSFVPKFVEVGAPLTEAKITFKSTIKPLIDAPYKMFCTPVADGSVLQVGNIVVPVDKTRSIQIASSLASGLKTGADGFLYDIQLLPYCPIPDAFTYTDNYNGQLYIGGGSEHIDYDIMYDNHEPIGFIFYCQESSFSTRCTGIGSIFYPSIPRDDPVLFKTYNECYKFRICAPNFSNFDNFNYFMNDGLSYFDIDCTYKPLTPYIKLNINYRNLYGRDWNDQRGLILGGDYSLPVLNDNWINYQIQNKNYSNIFERETQHLEYQHKWETASSVTGAVAGTVMGAAMGTAMGGMAGGIAGGVGAGLAGTADVLQTIFGHQEAMDYRKDMFQMNLQNIQALPQGLLKTSAFNENSRIWPFVEIYCCTSKEQEYVKNKIQYTGMSLGVIGQISTFYNPDRQADSWIQGRLIRIEGLEDETHIASELNRELNMGVYM